MNVGRPQAVLLVLLAALQSVLLAEPPKRVISVIPAVTEMLFAIGAGDRVVGVGSYDTYPPEVLTRPKVGALLDPDLERILSLRPDLVVVYESQTDLRTQLDRAKVPQFRYQHAGLADITTTILALGDRLELRPNAEKLVAEIDRQLAAVRDRVKDRRRPRTLLVFGRETEAVRSVNASGGYGFLHDMLEIAGGDNVFGDVKRALVQANTEAILRAAPEVILELRYGRPLSPEEMKREEASWSSLPGLPAVRTGRVHVIGGDDLVVPGPRVGAATQRLSEALHPLR
jgi:iron complex transport system substrate-binding protein